MKRIAAVLALGLCVHPTMVLAQAGSGTSFAYCDVEDTGGRKIWVSQVFPAPKYTDGMETEFHTYVGTLGGAGNKRCLVALTREDAQATRDKIEAIMRKRTFGISVYSWHDVNWTPSAAMYAATGPKPAMATDQFVYCRNVDVDSRKMVESYVFVASLPPNTQAGYFSELSRYGKEFDAQVVGQGVASGAMCLASDTRAEADKSREDFRKSFPFSGIKKIDVAFAPGPMPAAAIAPSRSAATTKAIATTSNAALANGADDEVEADFWRRIASSKNAQDFDDYLATYPQGRHAPIARLESRRLRGGAANAPAAKPGKPGARAPAASANVVLDPAYPIDDAIRHRIDSERFFRVPAATAGDPVQQSGSRMANKTVPIASALKAQRIAGSNICRVEQQISAGQSDPVVTTTTGLNWAGFIPLNDASKMSSQYGVVNGVVRAIDIDNLSGQPFPLLAGSAFGFRYKLENVDNSTGTKTFSMNWTCRVGATTPAAAVIAGTPGDQTELQCHASFEGLPLPERDSVWHWFGAAGCFLQDPTR